MSFSFIYKKETIKQHKTEIIKVRVYDTHRRCTNARSYLYTHLESRYPRDENSYHLEDCYMHWQRVFKRIRPSRTICSIGMALAVRWFCCRQCLRHPVASWPADCSCSLHGRLLLVECISLAEVIVAVPAAVGAAAAARCEKRLPSTSWMNEFIRLRKKYNNQSSRIAEAR